MKRTIGFVAAIAVSLPAAARGGGHGGSHSSSSSHSVSQSTSGSHSVKGHVTKKGTYVKPHRQSNPDNTQKNNWSTKGNVNPYTGKQGTKKAKH